MRRPIKKRAKVEPDERYNDVNVARLINYIMIRGQKETARKIVYAAFDVIKKWRKRISLRHFGVNLRADVTQGLDF